MKWAAGDAGKVRQSEAALQHLGMQVDDIINNLRNQVGDWRSAPGGEAPRWTGAAADRAYASWEAYLQQINTMDANYFAFGTQLEGIAGAIDDSVVRAEITLALSSVAFVVSIGLTIVTVGLSEGAVALEAVAAEAEVTGIFARLALFIRTGFTTALTQTLIRSAGSVGFQLVIPLAGTAVHNGVTGKPWTFQDIDSILIGSSLGLIVGELGMAAQLSGGLSLASQIALGATSQGAIGGLSSVIGQAALNNGGHIRWEVVGVSTGLGAVLGGVGAAGAAAVIKRFKIPEAVAPDQASANIQMTDLSPSGQPIGPASTETLSTVADPTTGRTATILQDPAGAPVLGAASLTADTAPQLAALGASEGRLAAAGAFTTSATTIGRLAQGVDDTNLAAQVAGLGDLDGVPGATFLASDAQEAQWLGGQLRGQMADLAALEAGTAERLAVSAPDPLQAAPEGVTTGPYADDVGTFTWQAASQEEQLVAQIHQTASAYANQLQALRAQIALAETPPGQLPNILAIPTVAPGVNAELEGALAVEQSVAATPLTGVDGAPATGAADLGLDPVDLVGIARTAAIKRIAAASVWGVALGGSSGALTGGLVMPHLDPPPTDITMPGSVDPVMPPVVD